ncbi:hypothetical protein QCB44_05370 [Thiomicrorhabdus sp. zzn3]|uniref:hypothetical protein n=1 Tax=Thiomicrorhabdus sp. zzn3 TaxID=3039775 RepID=UPI0024372105|nr:hypothetical protein [Thiomicrorhabdus sp. zzn3]MDG6778130.1 hypothetical protein [Thiomicrorhabdus sp. zzn3]
MTTAKPRSTTGSKLANSVRRAKANPKQVTPATTASTALVNTQTQKTIHERETITAMPCHRVWPD